MEIIHGAAPSEKNVMESSFEQNELRSADPNEQENPLVLS